jgi:hypothetical protein
VCHLNKASLRRAEEAMPEESDPGPNGAATMAAATSKILAAAEAEPVPEALVALAQKLEQTIADQLDPDTAAKNPR